jgi:hypothetical protein
MINKADLQAVLDEMKAQDRRTRVEPPTVDEMLAYRRGALSGDDEARVREQLLCWPELLRALMTPYPDDAAGALPPEVVERQWQAMKREIGAGGRVVSFRNALTAIAAALAVIFGALLWQARMELRRPRALPQQILLPDAQRGAGDGATMLTGTADAWLLTPTLIGEQRFDAYRFELVDANNRSVWKSGAIRRSEDDTLAVLVPRPFLPPGRYKLILYGVSGARQEQLESYSVRVPTPQ